jgi:hypothetical protein
MPMAIKKYTIPKHSVILQDGRIALTEPKQMELSGTCYGLVLIKIGNEEIEVDRKVLLAAALLFQN